MRILSVLCIAAISVSSAAANELRDACVERMTADGRDPAGCTCLADAVEGNQALIDEFMSLGEIADPRARYAAASADAKAAMDSCTR